MKQTNAVSCKMIHGRIREVKKNLRIAFLSVLSSFSLFALEKPYYNGYTGFLAEIKDDCDSCSKPSCMGESFFAGQLDFGGQLFLRGEFYVQAEDIQRFNYSDNFSRSDNAYFRLEELSATYKLASVGASHYLSAYMGNFEPIGSDLFLQRQFGISPIHSSFTESYHGIAGAVYFPLYARGIGYTVHPESDTAFSLNLYQNRASKDESLSDVLNLDFRAAALLGSATIDFSTGLSCPKNESGDTEYIVAIKEIYLHGGLNLLVGNKNTTSLYLNCGINRFALRKTGDDDDDDSSGDLIRNIYGILEARASGKYISFDTSGFIFQKESAVDMIFLRDIVDRNDGLEYLIGGNINAYTDRLYLASTKLTAGVHTTLTVSKIDPDGDNSRQIDVRISPYGKMDLFGGNLNVALSINPVNLIKEISESYSVSVGFKTNF
jgi:hypothetical protein